VLVLRSSQLLALRRDFARRVEDRLIRRIARLWPDVAAREGETGLRRLVRGGAARAQAYGIASVRDVATYLDVMLDFGPGFDTDPRLPWAGAILGNASSDGPRKAALLKRAAALAAERGRTPEAIGR
jgi:hypothetical protein